MHGFCICVVKSEQVIRIKGVNVPRALMPPTAPAAPIATTADADMEAAVDKLLEETGDVAAGMEAAEVSPSKRARKVNTSNLLHSPQHTPIQSRAYTASGCMHARALGAVLTGTKTNGLEKTAPGPKRSGVVHQGATESNREQTRANESKREQTRANESNTEQRSAALRCAQLAALAMRAHKYMIPTVEPQKRVSNAGLRAACLHTCPLC